MIDCETNYPDVVLEKLKEELKDLNITEKEFERRKKTGISSLYFMSDNIYKINSKIVSDIMEHGEIDYDPITTIRNYKYSKLKELVKTINLDNYSIIKVLPEN
jgi:predicted Zn-dependent peptidase